MSIGQLLARAMKLRIKAKLMINPEHRRDHEAEADRLTAEAEAQSKSQDDAAVFAQRVKENGGVWFPSDG